MRFFKGMTVLLGLAVPLMFTGAQAAEEKKAKTIAELAAMYDSSGCVDCHTEAHEQWQKSLHARSIFGPEKTGRTAATFRTTIENGLMEWEHSGVKAPEDVGVKHLMICAKCHLPQLEEAEDSVAKEIVKNIYAFAEDGDEDAAKALQSLNIGCTVCHGRNAIVHKWKDGTPQKDAVYGTKDGEHEDENHPVMKESKIMKESILCGQCHGLGPNFDLENPTQCATLYGAHLYTYKAEGGVATCQECHMEKSGLGHDMQSYRSPVMAKMALEVEVESEAYQWRDGSTMTPLADVIVELTNKAGHPIPDG
jgi:mono/diheme cytochrome c family protein